MLARLLLCCWLAWACTVQAGPLLLESMPRGQSLDGYLSVLSDPNGQLSLEEVRARDGDFAALPDGASFGFVPDVKWLRFSLQAPEGPPRTWWIELAYPSLDRVEFYAPDPQGGWSRIRVGDHQPFGERPFPYRNFILPVEFGGTATFYLRVETADAMTVPLRVWQPESFLAKLAGSEVLMGIYYGILLAMLIYNGAMGLALRDSTYAYYLMANLAILLVVAELNGHAFQFFWPGNLWLADNQHVLIPCFHFVATLLWQRKFLDTARRTPLLHRGVSGVIGLCAGLLLLSLSGFYPLANQLVFIVALLFIVILSIITLRCLFMGYRPARLFLAAQMAPLLGGLVVVGVGLGLLPGNNFTEYALQAGSAVEVLLFSLGLTARVQHLREEKAAALIMAQRDALTGLANRVALDDYMARTLATARIRRSRFAVLLVDLDHFKPVNDSHGHGIGDRLLQAVAQRLRACVRQEDMVARLGGDEFVIVLANLVGTEAADRIAAKVVESLATPFTVAGLELQISASIGVALYPEHGEDAHHLFNRADGAMYQAKQGGRGSFHTCSV
ncbi:diguanylate cyclase [Azovibrio restrictus]|uniref:diguanylate cyclase n=1 Tax=Azovibrio restrictus TaxID=146938 RepID=UPI0026EF9571|nr:diguanylate cyclase [Azovibrio restrictus]